MQSVINVLNFLLIVLNLYLQRQAPEEGNKTKEERRHRMDSCH